MSLLIILLLTIVQFFAGMGIVALFGLRLTPRILLPVAILLGMAVFSVVPWFLQLVYIPITGANVFLAMTVAVIALNARFKRSLETLKDFKKNFSIRVTLYELPFLAVILFIIAMSVWRCYYFPPLPRDLTSGAEVIAEYTIREKTMINSVFSVDLSTTNNQFKPPFITCLQIIYKYAGFPFGQVWLSSIFVCFILFLYEVLTRNLHRLIAGILMLFFLAVPEMYGYTIMVLFDYSNAVFFTLAVYYLHEYFNKKETKYIWFAGLILGIATYIRSETVILAALFIPLLLFYQWRKEKQKGIVPAIIDSVAFLLPSALFYLLSITIYINYYLPSKYAIGNQLNANLGDLSPFSNRFYEINSKLLTGEWSYNLYGTILVVFLIMLVLEAIFFKFKFTAQGKFWLYAVLVVYIGYPLLGYLLPLLDLDNSTKRGLFKLFPFLLLYMAHNQVLLKMSRWDPHFRNRVSRA